MHCTRVLFNRVCECLCVRLLPLPSPLGRLVVYGFHSMLPKRGGVLGCCEWLKMAMDYLRTPRFNPLDMTVRGTRPFRVFCNCFTEHAKSA